MWSCSRRSCSTGRAAPLSRKAAFAIIDDPNLLSAAISTAWDHRRETLAAYRQDLTRERRPREVLRSLLHELVVRRASVDAERERTLIRLARSIAARNLHKGATK